MSAAHEFLCAELARLVRLDTRFQAVEIDRTYIGGDDGKGGRYPDVRFRWEGFPESVLEVQLSNTFQPEISERGIFYESKGMPLLWILHGVEPRLDANILLPIAVLGIAYVGGAVVRFPLHPLYGSRHAPQ